MRMLTKSTLYELTICRCFVKHDAHLQIIFHALPQATLHFAVLRGRDLDVVHPNHSILSY